MDDKNSDYYNINNTNSDQNQPTTNQENLKDYDNITPKNNNNSDFDTPNPMNPQNLLQNPYYTPPQEFCKPNYPPSDNPNYQNYPQSYSYNQNTDTQNNNAGEMIVTTDLIVSPISNNINCNYMLLVMPILFLFFLLLK